MSEIISISNGSLTASIDTMGAQLMSLRKGESEYLWQGDSNWWPKTSSYPLPHCWCLKKTARQNLRKAPSLLPVMDLLASTSLRLSSRVPLL